MFCSRTTHCYICVLILLRVCPHSARYYSLLYMCPHTTTCVSAFCQVVPVSICNLYKWMPSSAATPLAFPQKVVVKIHPAMDTKGKTEEELLAYVFDSESSPSARAPPLPQQRDPPPPHTYSKCFDSILPFPPVVLPVFARTSRSLPSPPPPHARSPPRGLFLTHMCNGNAHCI